MVRRGLRPGEQAEAKLVFGSGLKYERVRIIEEVAWPNTIGRIGAWFAQKPPPTNNAVTLGNRLFFPVPLRTQEPHTSEAFLRDMSWLIHELAHAWQYQQVGTLYLVQATLTQLRLGTQSYEYGGEQGLIEAKNAGRDLEWFNREQQGDIARHYYLRRKAGEELIAWEHFVQDFRSV
jgi:hypothetical protein